jgi:hypothetical protein
MCGGMHGRVARVQPQGSLLPIPLPHLLLSSLSHPHLPHIFELAVANTTTKLGHRTLQPTLPQLVHPFPFPTLS